VYAAATDLYRVRIYNDSATANSLAGLELAVVNGDATQGAVVLSALASASYSADLVIQTRNLGTFQESARLTYAGGFSCKAGFGCNTKTPQTAYASGGALAAYVTGAFGLDSNANMTALYNLVVAMRAALVANGIMS
jgi:hypothetical protein